MAPELCQGGFWDGFDFSVTSHHFSVSASFSAQHAATHRCAACKHTAHVVRMSLGYHDVGYHHAPNDAPDSGLTMPHMNAYYGNPHNTGCRQVTVKVGPLTQPKPILWGHIRRQLIYLLWKRAAVKAPLRYMHSLTTDMPHNDRMTCMTRSEIECWPTSGIFDRPGRTDIPHFRQTHGWHTF